MTANDHRVPKIGDDGFRHYNCWIGNPHGIVEDTLRCVVEINQGIVDRHQCRNYRGHGPDGIYCRIHDPDRETVRAAIARRRADAETKYRMTRLVAIEKMVEFVRTTNVSIPDDVRDAIERFVDAEKELYDAGVPMWRVY